LFQNRRKSHLAPSFFFTSITLIFQTCIANGLHSLSQHECLTRWLSEIGALSAITKILTASCDSVQLNKISVITDSLGALRLLAKSSDKLKALGKFYEISILLSNKRIYQYKDIFYYFVLLFLSESRRYCESLRLIEIGLTFTYVDARSNVLTRIFVWHMSLFKNCLISYLIKRLLHSIPLGLVFYSNGICNHPNYKALLLFLSFAPKLLLLNMTVIFERECSNV